MNFEYYDQYINKATKGRCDVTPIFENPEVFSNLLDDLIEPFKEISFDKFAGLDALGFIIGGGLAQKCNKGFVAVRKGGKLPGTGNSVLKTAFTDYSKTSKSLEINRSSIKSGERILLIDEWIETGAQMKAAIKLIEKSGGIVVGIACLCAHKNQHTKVLFEKYNLRAIGNFVDET